MNASMLAEKMLEWEKKRRELDLLENWIKEQVLELGQTQTVGNVRASYSAGRKSYDYETAVNDWDKTHEYGLSDDVLQKFTKHTTDWRGVCKHYNIEEIPFSQSEPNVYLSLLER